VTGPGLGGCGVVHRPPVPEAVVVTFRKGKCCRPAPAVVENLRSVRRPGLPYWSTTFTTRDLGRSVLVGAELVVARKHALRCRTPRHSLRTHIQAQVGNKSPLMVIDRATVGSV